MLKRILQYLGIIKKDCDCASLADFIQLTNKRTGDKEIAECQNCGRVYQNILYEGQRMYVNPVLRKWVLAQHFKQFSDIMKEKR